MHGFFYLALPPEGELSLEELHLIVKDIWLTRYDKDLEQERAKRRKGRPKSTKEIQFEELKNREAEEYRTGFGSSLFFKCIDEPHSRVFFFFCFLLFYIS